jgi:hypothetical protein
MAGRGESGDDRNCSMTHSPGKIEYNVTFRTQIHKKKFGKNGFHTLQETMSHRPLTNASSLKITAAYCGPTPCLWLALKEVCNVQGSI